MLLVLGDPFDSMLRSQTDYPHLFHALTGIEANGNDIPADLADLFLQGEGFAPWLTDYRARLRTMLRLHAAFDGHPDMAHYAEPPPHWPTVYKSVVLLIAGFKQQ